MTEGFIHKKKVELNYVDIGYDNEEDKFVSMIKLVAVDGTFEVFKGRIPFDTAEQALEHARTTANRLAKALGADAKSVPLN